MTSASDIMRFLRSFEASGEDGREFFVVSIRSISVRDLTFASKTSPNLFAAGMRQRSLQILKFIFPLAREVSTVFAQKL